MKRYCVVLQHMDEDHIVVEFYWADNHQHAEEQAKDANPVDYKILATVRDPEQPEKPCSH